MVAATAAMLSVPAVAQADDFVGLSRSTFEGCQDFGWWDVQDNSGMVDYCVQAILTTGRNALTGEWGLSIQFFRPLIVGLPPGMTIESYLSQIAVTPIAESSEWWPYWHLGSLDSSFDPDFPPIVYHPDMVASSRPTFVNAYVLARDIPTGDDVWPLDDRNISMELVRYQVLPEPGTWALMGTGLLGLGGIGLARRRQA